jgi:hypothetical protein
MKQLLQFHFTHPPLAAAPFGSQLNSATKYVWFKATIDDLGSSAFSWSLDEKKLTSIGGSFKFGWGNYRGTRLGIYSYNNEAENGFVDVDFFHYTYANPQNKKWRSVGYE